MTQLITREDAEREAAGAGPLSPAQEVEGRLWQALQDVEDPEIPISVVGMGLIVSLAWRSDERAVDIELTYTAMGCPATEFIEGDIPRPAPTGARGRRGPHRGRVGSRLDPQHDQRGGPGDDAPSRDRGMSTLNATGIWEVFARKAYEDPLHHVGTITEDDEDLALVSARAIYDEQPWVHMIIVPRDAIREAIKP
jgi:hypothetical protein